MITLLNLLAAVSLLVWGTHIVRRDILQVYGGDLRRLLSRSVGNRFNAAFAGLVVTGLLQSSTATALLTTSFANQGLIATVPALAIMLGADVGTALVSLLLSIDLAWLSPLLILVGVVVYLPRQNSKAGRIGRILIGLGLMLLALRLIVLATRPLMETAPVKVLFASLTGDSLLDMVLGALFTMLSYSSLAVVLLTAAFAASNLISLPVAIALVLGANLGSGLLGMLNTTSMSREARRVALGNLLFKLAGCAVALLLLGPVQRGIDALDVAPSTAVVLFHLGFNLALALVFVFATEPVARLAALILPPLPEPISEADPRYLDPNALGTPALAIGCAAREAMRIGDAVESMLQGLLEVIRTGNQDLAQRVRATDDVVDRLYTAVKLYLTQIGREALDEREGRRWTDILSFVINLEQIGDIVERLTTDIEERKIAKGLQFSEAGLGEICDLHGRLLGNLRLGTSVFMSRDVKAAQRLLAEKVLFRELERAYSGSHFDRLAGHTQPSIETSSLHLDLLSAMRRINSHICSVAYPILEEAGVLQQPSLAAVDEAGRTPPQPGSPDAAGGSGSWQKGDPTPA